MPVIFFIYFHLFIFPPTSFYRDYLLHVCCLHIVFFACFHLLSSFFATMFVYMFSLHIFLVSFVFIIISLFFIFSFFFRLLTYYIYSFVCYYIIILPFHIIAFSTEFAWELLQLLHEAPEDAYFHIIFYYIYYYMPPVCRLSLHAACRRCCRWWYFRLRPFAHAFARRHYSPIIFDVCPITPACLRLRCPIFMSFDMPVFRRPYLSSSIHLYLIPIFCRLHSYSSFHSLSSSFVDLRLFRPPVFIHLPLRVFILLPIRWYYTPFSYYCSLFRRCCPFILPAALH